MPNVHTELNIHSSFLFFFSTCFFSTRRRCDNSGVLGYGRTYSRSRSFTSHCFTERTDVVARSFYACANIYDKIVTPETLGAFFKFLTFFSSSTAAIVVMLRARRFSDRTNGEREQTTETMSTRPGDESERRRAVTADSVSGEPNLKGDWFNFFLLILLYTMQGVPLGFTQVIPIILQSNKEYASYKDQVSQGVGTRPKRFYVESPCSGVLKRESNCVDRSTSTDKSVVGQVAINQNYLTKTSN